MSGGEGYAVEVGERMLFDEELNACGQSLAVGALATRVREDALEILAGKRAVMRSYEEGLGRTEIFFDVIMPPLSLVIFGAEHDAVPLVRPARELGWQVTVVDTRARKAAKERFAEADEVLLCRAEDVVERVSLTENTAIVVMTHNYLDDVELLRALLPSPVFYLGVLGPKQRTSKLLEEIGAECSGLAASQFARLHSPIGMDIGAETPEEIALAIICEIKAACAGRKGGFLRDRDAPIHDEQQPSSIEVSIEPYAPTRESASTVACHSS
jgi:xanthine/CO dehydrogenase XdhC/CoxF family maturation factor